MQGRLKWIVNYFTSPYARLLRILQVRSAQNDSLQQEKVTLYRVWEKGCWRVDDYAHHPWQWLNNFRLQTFNAAGLECLRLASET